MSIPAFSESIRHAYGEQRVCVSPEELAAMLNLSRQTIYRHIEQGTLKAAKVGQQWRIRGEWVDEWNGGPTND